MLTSVITRTKDRPSFLRRARESVQAQTTPVFWSVVNDGGDATAVEAEIAAAREHGVTCRVIHHARSMGRPAAANAGIRQTDTPYFLILDDDDRLMPDAVSRLEAGLAAWPGDAGILGQVRKVEERRGPDGQWQSGRSEIANPERGPLRLVDLAYRNIVPLNGLLLRRASFDRAGGFDEGLPVLEDWDLLLKILRQEDIGRLYALVAEYYIRPEIEGEEDPAGNSVAAGHDLHEEYEVRLRNRYLRKDLDTGRAGLGFLMNPPHRLPMERINVLATSLNGLAERQIVLRHLRRWLRGR
jgi:glycosyltransferase involved in cell wall biosynthesis